MGATVAGMPSWPRPGKRVAYPGCPADLPPADALIRRSVAAECHAMPSPRWAFLPVEKIAKITGCPAELAEGSDRQMPATGARVPELFSRISSSAATGVAQLLLRAAVAEYYRGPNKGGLLRSSRSATAEAMPTAAILSLSDLDTNAITIWSMIQAEKAKVCADVRSWLR